MVKDSAITSQFQITNEGLALFGIENKVVATSPEALIYWDEVSLFQKMLYALPTDSMVGIFKSKGTQHWNSADYKDLPAPVAPFRPNWDSDQPLKGLRVALDPGHIGGTMEFAEMEKKFIKILPGPENGIDTEISFNEGNLALGTSLLLAKRLRAQGAEVLLTREKEGLTAFGNSFENWLEGEKTKYDQIHQDGNLAPPVHSSKLAQLKYCAAQNYIDDYDIPAKQAKWWRTKAKLSDIYRIPFLKAEFIERAKNINTFRPHLTFVIHFNVHESNEPKSNGYRATTEDNFCMAFIPGSFMAGELKTTEERLAFTAKLLTEDISRSQSLCAHFIQQHESQLEVPAIEWDDNLKYLRKASLRTPEKGVFARNLQLTRLINGPLCFGESLYQDNIEECLRLNSKDFILPGMTSPLPERIRTVSDAYYGALIDWLRESN